jgi:hypothetical protein
VKRQTIAKRLRAKIRTVKATLWKRRHLPIPVQGRWLRGVVQEYFNYFAIPGNLSSLAMFLPQEASHSGRGTNWAGLLW